MYAMVKLVARNIVVANKRTSVRLETHMWESLKEIANREKCDVNDICNVVYDQLKDETSFTSSLRLFIFLYFKAASTEMGHKKAGHGKFSNILDRAARINGIDYDTM